MTNKEENEYGIIEITEVVRYGLRLYRVDDGWKIEENEEVFPTLVKAEKKAKETGKTKKRY